MTKKVFVVLGGSDGVERYLGALDNSVYEVERLDMAASAGIGSLFEGLHAHAAAGAAPFVFLVDKKRFRYEESTREVSLALAAAGIAVEPIFFVVAKAFSADEMSRILRRGNLFVLPRTGGGRGRPTGFVRFEAALEKAFVDFELQGRLARYVAEDLQSFADSERLRSTKEEVERVNQELSIQNRVDELTKLLNRRGIIESMRVAKGRAGRERWRLAAKADQGDAQRPPPAGEINEFFGHLSCMMVDVDHFKRINDTYGHLVGDEVLRTIGRLFHRKGIFRAEDICGRYGGEEFTVILPATSAVNAAVPADKFRAELSRLVFRADNGEKFNVTASVGIAELSDSEETIDEIISKADAALYRAKENGRNQTVVYEEGSFTHEDVYRAAEKLGGDLEELGGK